ncbi:MAG: DNA polymerase III subunit delta [bacterium]
MADKKDTNAAYKALVKDLKAKKPQRAYVFFGKERYLLQHALTTLRAMVAAGSEEFNDRRLSGKTATIEDYRDAADTPPVFSDFALVEVEDADFTKLDEKGRLELASILADLPENVTFVFLLAGEEFKLDGRLKGVKELKSALTEVQFVRQEGQEIAKWVMKNVLAEGKRMDAPTASFLAFYTDGLMTTMKGEIAKLCAYVDAPVISEADIRAVCIPSPEAATYELTDALLAEKWSLAAQKAGDLLHNEVAAHIILFSLGAKARELMAARVLRENGGSWQDLKAALGMKFDFQARDVFKAAVRFPLPRAKRWVNLTAEAAYRLNSGSVEEAEVLSELLARLAEARA